MNKYLKVSSTNPTTGKGPSVIRVYKGGVLIAEEKVTKRSPLKYLKTLNHSKHKVSLERQMMPHGVTLKEIGL